MVRVVWSARSARNVRYDDGARCHKVIVKLLLVMFGVLLNVQDLVRCTGWVKIRSLLVHRQHGIVIDRDVDVDRVRRAWRATFREAALRSSRYQVIGDIVGDRPSTGAGHETRGL